MASLLPERPNGAGAPVVPFDPKFPGGLRDYPEPPGEEGLNVRAIWALLRRYWLLILGCVILAGALGWYWTGRITPVYEAAASLRIAESESAVPGLEVLKTLRGQGSEVNTELQVLKSRALADSVVARLGMRLSVLEPRRVPRSRLVASAMLAPTADTGRMVIEWSGRRVTVTGPDSTVVMGRPGDTIRVGPATLVLARGVAGYPRAVLSLAAPAAATRALMGGLRVTRPSREANILTVSVRHSDPEMAAAAANALLGVFLEQRVATRRTGARSTVDFLRVQMDTLGIELRRAEDSLKAFREQEQVVAIETQAQVSVGKLAELKAARDEVASELQALDVVLAGNLSTPEDSAGGSAYRRLLAFPTLLRNPSVSTLLTSLTALENQRSTLLTRRTMRDPEVVTLTGQIGGVEAQIRGLVTSYTNGLRAQVAAYDRTLAQSGSQLSAIPAKEVQLARLMRSTSILGELSTLLQTRLKEAEIAQAVEDPSAQVVDQAVLPEQPVSPRRRVNFVLSLMLGLGLALLIIFARESLDTKVHSRDDLQELAQAPVLGVIPHFEPERPGTAGRFRRLWPKSPASGGESTSMVMVAASHPASSVIEAYRALRTTLAFALAERPPKIVVITSPTPEDGKSTSTANLAASLAQQKLKVLVIDGDMRRGALHRLLGGVRKPGLSELLAGLAEFPGVIQALKIEGLGRIDLISTGTLPPNPTDLLSSHRLTDLLQAAEPLYDTILIDTPPVNAFADALVLAPHADGVVLVARGNKTEREAVRFAMELIAGVRGTVMGTVLNDFDTRRADAYGDYYYAGTGYGPVTEE